MSDSSVPFYTQAAILDRYIHSSTPKADPDALEVILEGLRSRPDLRAYFFRRGPHPAWAEILWDSGFFENPPPPQEAVGGGIVLPRWDVQQYLVSVADQVPDIVVRHVESAPKQGWYILPAIWALCSIPSAKVEGVLQRIVEWLTDPQIARTIADGVMALTAKLAADGYVTAAFTLFRTLIAPVPFSDVRRVAARGFEAQSKLRSDWEEDQILGKGIALLTETDNSQLVSMLEEHLRTALRLEAVGMNQQEFESGSWWRVAIEDTDQDLNPEYKHKLLRALREALEQWVRQDPGAVESSLNRYLDEPSQILRRLGLHILSQFPSKYVEYVKSELCNHANLDDTAIHHEFFMLLQRGYRYLEASEQGSLLTVICNGPPPSRLGQYEKWAAQDDSADPDEYVQTRINRWVRDRLWMLRNHPTGQVAQQLENLVEELGSPEHPEFTHWISRPFWEREVTPIPEDGIADLSPDRLVSFLREWQPVSAPGFGPGRTSYKDLAKVVARVVLADLGKYKAYLTCIAFCHSAFAYALLERIREDMAQPIPWPKAIELCEELLSREMVRHDMSHDMDDSWTDVRRAIVRLLEMGIKNPGRAVPGELFDRVRDILLVLIDDPDPDLSSEPTPDKWRQLNDPATVAINHVRPNALLALIDYAGIRAQPVDETDQDMQKQTPGPQRLEPRVQAALTRRLNRDEDLSWAVHSVYGQRLALLYWLDQSWTESHIDEILPEGDDEHSVWLYVAAWDAFVTFNYFYRPMIEMLRPKYRRAIDYMGKGYVTQTHLGPARQLGVHVTWEYLLADYELNSTKGQDSLIGAFLDRALPEDRGTPAWVIWRTGDNDPAWIEAHWPRVRSLWEWRTRKATVANHPTDFDQEMSSFADLLGVVPPSENMTTLWPLLEGLLSHITRTQQMDSGWNAVERYLASQVEQDPLRAIQFYHLMHGELHTPRWHYPEEGRRIVEVAAEHAASRAEALSLIDLLGRLGDDRFKDIYDRYV